MTVKVKNKMVWQWR